MRILVTLLLAGAACLVAQEPADVNGWINRGVQQFKSENYPAAVASFERAVAMDPNRLSARLYLGTAYMQQGMTLPAEDQFRRVLETEPGNKVALASLGSLNLNQKKWDEALNWYRKLIEADPQNAQAYYSIGFVAWSKWYPEYAKARAATGLRPEQPGPIADVQVRNALNAQYGPMLEAGIQAMNKALEINPQYDDAMAYLNLLARERADLRATEAEYMADVSTADDWVQKALAAKRAKAGRTAGYSIAPPPPAPPPPPPPRR